MIELFLPLFCILLNSIVRLQARDVAAGVSYLHANDIIHGDLKGVRTTLTFYSTLYLTPW